MNRLRTAYGPPVSARVGFEHIRLRRWPLLTRVGERRHKAPGGSEAKPGVTDDIPKLAQATGGLETLSDTRLRGFFGLDDISPGFRFASPGALCRRSPSRAKSMVRYPPLANDVSRASLGKSIDAHDHRSINIVLAGAPSPVPPTYFNGRQVIS
jgi:hypothetical protein